MSYPLFGSSNSKHDGHVGWTAHRTPSIWCPQIQDDGCMGCSIERPVSEESRTQRESLDSKAQVQNMMVA